MLKNIIKPAFNGRLLPYEVEKVLVGVTTTIKASKASKTRYRRWKRSFSARNGEDWTRTSTWYGSFAASATSVQKSCRRDTTMTTDQFSYISMQITSTRKEDMLMQRKSTRMLKIVYLMDMYRKFAKWELTVSFWFKSSRLIFKLNLNVN